MEDLIFQFDISAIEDHTKLFDLDSYNAWAATELEQEHEEEKTKENLEKTEEHLGSEMEMAMSEYYKFEEEMNLECEKELVSLVKIGDRVWTMGNLMEYGTNRYFEAAIRSAGDKVRSVWGRVHKVHPS